MSYKQICINVGAYTSKELEELIKNDSETLLYCFEPNPDATSELIETFKNAVNVIVRPDAVSYQNGQQTFYLCGQSSSLHKTEDCETISVNTISLSQIVNEFVCQHSSEIKKILVMNCEGEEVPIILNTPLKDLEQFDIIVVEFHPDVNSEHDEDKCWNKLSNIFSRAIKYGSVSKHPRYTFRKRQ